MSFSVVPGAVLTENVHLAFPGSEEDVRRFHAEATAAGYRDNGMPASARSTTRATTPPTSWIRTGTTSRSSTTTGTDSAVR